MYVAEVYAAAAGRREGKRGCATSRRVLAMAMVVVVTVVVVLLLAMLLARLA